MAEEVSDETPCPIREDGMHCNCWYDGDRCCACGEDVPARPFGKAQRFTCADCEWEQSQSHIGLMFVLAPAYDAAVARAEKAEKRVALLEADYLNTGAAEQYDAITERVAALEAGLRKWASECGKCGGSGRIVEYDTALYVGQLCSPIGDSPCEACADIRALLGDKP